MTMEDINPFLIYFNTFIIVAIAIVLLDTLYSIFKGRELFSSKKPHFVENENIPLGRKNDIMRLADYIVTGQSSAIVGIFDEERTAMLNVLRDKDQFDFLYGKQAKSLIFSSVDISTFGEADLTPQTFWARALKPLEELDSTKDLYQLCDKNAYGEYYLSKLLEKLGDEGIRLVLLVDQFDLLLDNNNIFNAGFFATLRSLSSSSTKRTLTTILTMRITAHQFIQLRTGVTGSSLISHVEAREIILHPLAEDELIEALKQRPALINGFSDNLLKEISRLVGGHPYLTTLILQWWLAHQSEFEEKSGADIIHKLEQQLADFEIVQEILEARIVKDGKFTTIKDVFGSLDSVSSLTIKELEKLGLLKDDAGKILLNPPLLNSGMVT